MIIEKGLMLRGSAGRPIAVDIFAAANSFGNPVVIYSHGFNGFKDWGNFDLIARQFAEAGFVFVKYNFSHNGTTPDQPEDFADLEAYGNNNYTKELHDLQVVIDWAMDERNPYAAAIDPRRLYLLGHSRGGGISIIKAAEESRVTGLVTWASVAACTTPWGSWNEEKLAEWQRTGVQYYFNARTQQQMPLYYQLYLDYQENADRLDIAHAMRRLAIPVLICHGDRDEAVRIDKAHLLHQYMPEASLFIVESDHVFGRKHPCPDPVLPLPMQQVVDRTIEFFRSCTGTRGSA